MGHPSMRDYAIRDFDRRTPYRVRRFFSALRDLLIAWLLVAVMVLAAVGAWTAWGWLS